MNKLDKVKLLIRQLDSRELTRLLDYIRRKSDIIIPKCYTKEEIISMVLTEGISEKLSDSDFICLKNEFDNGCKEIMNEVLRTRLMVSLDQSQEILSEI